FGAMALVGAWLTTTWSAWLWSHARLLQYLQLPWRALVIPGLFMPLLAIFVLERVGKIWAVALVAVLVAINLPHTEPKRYLTYDDEYYSPASLAAKGINTTTFDEFAPRWVDQRPPYDPRPLVGLTGPLEVQVISRRTVRHEYLVKAP